MITQLRMMWKQWGEWTNVFNKNVYCFDVAPLMQFVWVTFQNFITESGCTIFGDSDSHCSPEFGKLQSVP